MVKLLNILVLGKPSMVGFSAVSRWSALLASAASLTLFTSPHASAQNQNQTQVQNQNQDNSSNQQQAQPDAQPQDQSAPAPAPQDNRRVISRDNLPQNQNAQTGRDDQNDDQYDRDDQYNRDNRGQNPDDSRAQQRPPASNRRQYPRAQNAGNVPATLTIPAGKVIFIRLNERLSSDHSHQGDGFTATLDQPIIVNGWVVARRGDTVVGDVTTAQKAGRVKGVSQLGLELSDINIVDGQQLPLVTELWNGSAGTSHGNDAAGIATTTGAGTIIGAAANGGEGAGIGAGAGAVAGIAMVLLTRGNEVDLHQGTTLDVVFDRALVIEWRLRQLPVFALRPRPPPSSGKLTRMPGARRNWPCAP